MEDVHLDFGQGVEGSLDDADGLEVAADIDHEAAPREARCILNGNGGQREAARVGLDQLQKSLKTVHGSYVGGRLQMCVLWGDLERVRLVFVDALHLFARAVDRDRERTGGA